LLLSVFVFSLSAGAYTAYGNKQLDNNNPVVVKAAQAVPFLPIVMMLTTPL